MNFLGAKWLWSKLPENVMSKSSLRQSDDDLPLPAAWCGGAGHVLEATEHAQLWKCDQCLQDILPSVGDGKVEAVGGGEGRLLAARSFRCDLCDYDCCEDCVLIAAQTGVLPKKKLEDKRRNINKTTTSGFAAGAPSSTKKALTDDDDRLFEVSTLERAKERRKLLPLPPESVCASGGHRLIETLHTAHQWNCDGCNQMREVVLVVDHGDDAIAGVRASADNRRVPVLLRSLRCDSCDYDCCEECWSKIEQDEVVEQDLIKVSNGASGVEVAREKGLKISGGGDAASGGKQLKQKQAEEFPLTAAGMITQCPEGHDLKVTLHPRDCCWNCDLCDLLFGGDEEESGEGGGGGCVQRRSLRCDLCDYDICDECWMFGRPQQLPPASGDDSEQTTTSENYSVVVCSKPKSSSSSSSSSSCLRKLIVHDQHWACDKCHFQFHPNTLSSTHCEDCNTDVCELCMLKEERRRLQRLLLQQQRRQ